MQDQPLHPHRIIELDTNTVRVIVTTGGADVWNIKRTLEQFAKGRLVGNAQAW